MALTASHRLEATCSDLYLRGDVPSWYAYHTISTIHHPSSKRSVACACCAVASCAGPRMWHNQKLPSMPTSLLSTATARNCPFASVTANSASVAV
eukprot:7377552-Prymnesium_polylepis.2